MNNIKTNYELKYKKYKLKYLKEKQKADNLHNMLGGAINNLILNISSNENFDINTIEKSKKILINQKNTNDKKWLIYIAGFNEGFVSYANINALGINFIIVTNIQNNYPVKDNQKLENVDKENFINLIELKDWLNGFFTGAKTNCIKTFFGVSLGGYAVLYLSKFFNKPDVFIAFNPQTFDNETIKITYLDAKIPTKSIGLTNLKLHLTTDLLPGINSQKIVGIGLSEATHFNEYFWGDAFNAGNLIGVPNLYFIFLNDHRHGIGKYIDKNLFYMNIIERGLEYNFDEYYEKIKITNFYPIQNKICDDIISTYKCNNVFNDLIGSEFDILKANMNTLITYTNIKQIIKLSSVEGGLNAILPSITKSIEILKTSYCNDYKHMNLIKTKICNKLSVSINSILSQFKIQLLELSSTLDLNVLNLCDNIIIELTVFINYLSKTDQDILLIFDSNGVLGKREDIILTNTVGTNAYFESFNVGPYLLKLLDNDLHIGIWGGKTSPVLMSEISYLFDKQIMTHSNFEFVKGFESTVPEQNKFILEYFQDTKKISNAKILVPKSFNALPNIKTNFVKKSFILLIDDDADKNILNEDIRTYNQNCEVTILSPPKYPQKYDKKDINNFKLNWKNFVKHLINLKYLTSNESKCRYIKNNMKEYIHNKNENKEVVDMSDDSFKENIEKKNYNYIAKIIAMRAITFSTLINEVSLLNSRIDSIKSEILNKNLNAEALKSALNNILDIHQFNRKELVIKLDNLCSELGI